MSYDYPDGYTPPPAPPVILPPEQQILFDAQEKVDDLAFTLKFIKGLEDITKRLEAISGELLEKAAYWKEPS